MNEAVAGFFEEPTGNQGTGDDGTLPPGPGDAMGDAIDEAIDEALPGTPGEGVEPSSEAPETTPFTSQSDMVFRAGTGRATINEWLETLPPDERREAGRFYIDGDLFEDSYEHQFLDYAGVLPTGDRSADQAAIDAAEEREEARQQQALEDYNRGFKSYTGAESTGDQEQDAALWEAESERRVGETQAWLDQGLELANQLGQESKNRADMIGNLNPGDQQRVGVGEVDAAQDSRFQDWLAAEPDLGFDNSAYRAELSEYLASLQGGEQQHLEDH